MKYVIYQQNWKKDLFSLEIVQLHNTFLTNAIL